MTTKKGPGKLKKAVSDSDLDADLRAHAVENLIRIDEQKAAFGAIKDMDEQNRTAVIEKLVPRLWAMARIQGALAKPNSAQVSAKDALFQLRDYATGSSQTAIDSHLVEWLTAGYYAGRARMGRSGEIILRAIGAPASKAVIASASAVVGAKPDAKGQRERLEPKLLLAVAVVGTEQGVGFLLKVAKRKLGDPELERNALLALYNAYVKPDGFPAADAKALAPHVEKLAAIIRDPEQKGENIQIALELISLTGMPHCLPPLLAAIREPARSRLRWVGAQRAILCGKLKAAGEVLAALPTRGSYSRENLGGSIWNYIVKEAGPPADVAAFARGLLTSDSWVSRISAVELLGMLKIKSSASADAAAIEKMARDKTPLRGWHLPATPEKRPPTLGQRAREVATSLRELAKEGEK